MENRFKFKLVFVWIYLILGMCLNAIHTSTWAATLAKTDDKALVGYWESYLDRPDILSIEPKEHQGLGLDWDNLRAAHFSFVAELLELYKGDLYFLARDSEYLYDVARLVTRGTPDAKRIRLLNVSRANMRDENLLEYLEQNGISETELKNGKKIHLIDTGFAGTIPRVISELFSPALRDQIKTHLIVSGNPKHPSSRVFLSHINPAINSLTLKSMHGTIVAYEHMPRYTDRSVRLTKANGIIHPLSAIQGGADGTVSKQRAIRYMEDLSAHWEKPSTQQLFASERAQAARLRELFELSAVDKKSAIEQIQRNLSESQSKHLYESLVRDFIDAQEVAGLTAKINIDEVGFKAIEKSQTDFLSKKELYIEKFPDWAPILENPENEIPKLLQEKNWQMIGNLIDANVDADINLLLAKNIFDAPATGVKLEMQKLLIANGSEDVLKYLVKEVFPKPYAKDMADLIEQTIMVAPEKILNLLARDVFTKPHTAGMKQALRLLITKGKMDTHLTLSADVFSKPHTVGMEDVLKFMIENTSLAALSNLAQFSFRLPHTEIMVDAIEMILRRSDYATAKNMMNNAYVFKMKKNLSDERIRTLYAACEILKNEDRKEFLNWKIGPHGPKASAVAPLQVKEVFADPSLTTIPSELTPVSKNIGPGNKIKIGSTIYTVVSHVDDGRRGKVFKIQDGIGNFFALKVAKDKEPETLESLANEKKKQELWQEIGIPHSQIIFADSLFVLKTWIEGTRGDVIVEQALKGNPDAKSAMLKLLNLVSNLQNQGVFVGDFRPSNLLWANHQWVLVDSGNVKFGLSKKEAYAKWSEIREGQNKFDRRWKHPGPKLYNSCQSFYL